MKKIYFLFMFYSCLCCGCLYPQTDALSSQPKSGRGLDSLGKYTYFLIQYSQPAESLSIFSNQQDGFGTASGFFVRVRERLFLISNYHIITGVDVYHQKRYDHQFSMIKVRYFDKDDNPHYLPIDVDSIRTASKVLFFLEYPDIYVLEINEKDLCKDARIFSLENIIYAKSNMGECQREPFSYQYLPNQNIGLNEQINQIRLAGPAFTFSYEFTTPLPNYTLNSLIPQSVIPPTINNINDISTLPYQVALSNNPKFPDRLPKLLEFQSPVTVYSNLLSEYKTDVRIFEMNDTLPMAEFQRSLGVSKRVVPTEIFNRIEIPITDSLFLLSISQLRGQQNTRNSWPSHLSNNFGMMNLDNPNVTGVMQAPGYITLNNSLQPQSANARLSLVSDSSSLLSIFRSTSPENMKNPWPSHLSNNFGVINLDNPKVTEVVQAPGYITLNNSLQPSSVNPWPFDHSDSTLLLTLSQLHAAQVFDNPWKSNISNHVAVFNLDSLNITANRLPPGTLILNNPPPQQILSLPFLSGPNTQSPPLLISENNARISLSNPESPQSQWKAVPLSMVDRMNFDDIHVSYYSGQFADQNIQRFLPPEVNAKYLVMAPSTDHGSSGSPVFFKCSCTIGEKTVESIEFAGVQSGIAEQLSISFIVKAEQVIDKINEKIYNYQ